MALGTRSARCACVRRPPTPPLLSRCSCGFALANPPLVSAARSSYKIEATRSLYTFPRCAAVGDGSALPQHDPHPAAGPLAQRASVAEDDWSVSGPTLDPLTGRSPTAAACPSDASGASARPEFAAAALYDVAHQCSSRQACAEFAQICFQLHEQSGPQEWQLGPLPFRPAVTADPARPSGAQHSLDA